MTNIIMTTMMTINTKTTSAPMIPPIIAPVEEEAVGVLVVGGRMTVVFANTECVEDKWRMNREMST